MEGTDIDGHIDENIAHDHSYYGNGHSAPQGGGGSAIAGTTRIVKTYDNENQKNGTYYTYQAATSGSGGSTYAKDNTNVPDSFCPLGWQLPYGGTGGDYYVQSRSWNNLMTVYNYDNNVTGQNSAGSYPLSIILAGYFFFTTSRLYNQGNDAQYATATSRTENYAFIYYIGWNENKNTRTQHKQEAGTTRYVYPSSTARWKEQTLIQITLTVTKTIILPSTAMGVQMAGGQAVKEVRHKHVQLA